MTSDQSIDWSQGLCISMDPEIFFESSLEALAVDTCRMCPIRPECLTFAIETKQEFGVWGGQSEETRTRILTPRNRVKCPGCFSTLVDVSQLGSQHCDSCGLSWNV